MEATVSASPDVKVTYQTIPVDQIQPSPHQARKDFDEESLKGLAESMRHEGLIDPIVVRRQGSRFELISGERRLRAAKNLGWEAIEAKIIATVSDAEAAAKGLVENVQRVNLNPVEEAEAFNDLQKLDPDYWTQAKIGLVLGKGRDYISRSLALLSLPEVVMAMLRQRNISREHGIELLRIDNTNSLKGVANRIVKGGLSVKQTREMIDRYLTKIGDDPDLATRATRVPGVSDTGANTGAKAPIDPLAEVWLPIQIDPDLRQLAAWQVSFGSYRVMGEQMPEAPCWRFYVMTPGMNSKSELAQWFQGMAEALGAPGAKHQSRPKPAEETAQKDHATAEVPSEDAMANLGKFLPANIQEAKRMEEEQSRVRLPKTPEEHRELEALAAQGPGAVYAGVWGAKSLMAEKMRTATWKDLDVTDPIEGCRLLLDGMKN